MDKKQYKSAKISLSRIFLLNSNPRHEPFDSEGDAINYLCEKEDVLALARDITRNGLNPLELCALIPDEEKKGSNSYLVAEGNRRICALKLLTDPELAPAKIRKYFKSLSDSWSPVNEVNAVVFPDLESVKIWLDRTHNGAQGGVGRRQWTSDQKSRFDGNSKNKLAQSLLDYAVSNEFLTADERTGKLTTVQRFLVNATFCEAIGIDKSKPELISRTRPEPDFKRLLEIFMRDLIDRKKVNSRMNKPEIEEYAAELSRSKNLSGDRVKPTALVNLETKKKQKTKLNDLITKPQKIRKIKHEDQIAQSLATLGNIKLQSLYHSICSIELQDHCPLVAVGIWSFFETLTACQGRDGVDFHSFLSKNKLRQLGIDGNIVTLSDAVKRISVAGNSTKHHSVAAAFSPEQLNNDMTTLKVLLVRCIDDALSNGEPKLESV